ncbi:hypothetical protein CR513_58620, partial [Mucuna pruriens]
MAIAIEGESTKFTPCSETESVQFCCDCLRLAENMSDDYKRAYQIGVVVGDTSSFVSLCAKPEVKSNPESVDCRVSRVLESKMENNNERTLKELATPDVVYQPWCIQYPQLEPAQTYELKS